MFDMSFDEASCSNDSADEVTVEALPAAAMAAAVFNSVRFGETKLSSSSSSIGLFGVIATGSLKHKHAQ